MSFQDTLLTLMQQPAYTPQTFEELLHTLQLSRRHKRKLKSDINHLLDEGTIVKFKQDRYVIPKHADLITGVIKFRQNGAGMIFPDSTDKTASKEPTHIRPENTLTAMHGDTVLARIVKDKGAFTYSKGKRVLIPTDKNLEYAKVLRIIKSGNATITGTLQRGSKFFYVIPDDPRFQKDIIVEDPSQSSLNPKPQADDKVIVENLEWENRYINPVGDIASIIGPSHTPQAEMAALLHKYHLSHEFPREVEKEVKKLPTEVRKKDCKGRMDCRDLFTLTIDPDDAKDFDDALSLEELDNGNFRIGVHIADVSAYVKYNSALDKEAQERGNSTYLVGSVVPMLPHELSSGLCSLKEAEDRLTKTAFLTYTKRGILKDVQFANTVINSNKRLTYKQAYAFLTEDDFDKIRQFPSPPAHQTGFAGRSLNSMSEDELDQTQQTIRRFWSIAKELRKQRMQKGSLDLEMPEVKIFVDEEGYPDRIERIHNDESHQLIEEFMLAANDAVARTFHKANMPFISRVHDKPDAERLQELSDTLAAMGVATGDLTHKPAVTKLLKQFKTHPQGHSLKIQFLRSLKQACYRADADGHYGLHKTYYAHFTSPIRRYSDLIVHRVLDEHLYKQQLDTAPKKVKSIYSKSKQDSLAKHLSLTEQNSTEAERESKKLTLIEFFELEQARKNKRPFDAIITDIKNHGMFIELSESLAFGMIHISTLHDDLYSVTSNGNSLVGRKKKRQYSMNQVVQVVIERVDRFKRQMDFRLTEDYESGSKVQKKRSSTRSPAAKKKPYSKAKKDATQTTVATKKITKKKTYKKAASKVATTKKTPRKSPTKKRNK